MSQQQKGETMPTPEVESRSVQRRKALQKGEKMPTFDGKPIHFGGWTHSLEELDAICDVAISSPQNPDGSMQTNHVMNPQFYADVKRLVVAVRRFYEMDYRNMKAGFYWCLCGWEGPDRMSYWKHLEALQSAPSDTPPPEISHYEYRVGRGYLEPVMQPSDAGQPCPTCGINAKLNDGRIRAYAEEVNGLLSRIAKLEAALEKLRELEAKWRAKVGPLACGNTAAAGCVKMFADELHAIITPAPRPAEKD